MHPPQPLDGVSPELWLLDPTWSFLNAGSFGLRLREVYEARLALLGQMDTQPVEFLERTAPPLWERARAALADFVSADVEGLGFVANATEGIDAVLVDASIRDGRVLVGDQAYGAVKAASQWGANLGSGHVEEVKIPLPVEKVEDVVAMWDAALADGAALAIVDHVTSGTALVQPVAEIVQRCRAHDVPVLIDGAHAPGLLDLDIAAIGADWYVGNLHKWVGAPSGAGFIWTAPQHRDRTRPLALSHECADSYEAAFMWQGTRDVTPWLLLPEAIQAVSNRWGWTALRQWQHEMAMWSCAQLVEALGTEPSDGTGGKMTAAMTSVRIPGEPWKQWADRFAMRDAIASRHKIELAIDDLAGAWWVRLSMGPWVQPEEIGRAADAVKECLV